MEISGGNRQNGKMPFEKPPYFDPARIALFLDVDGTLLDIALRPDAVHVPDGLIDTLLRIQALASGALALVSGRSVAQLDQIFGASHFAAAGCHGAEIRFLPDGKITRGESVSTACKARFAALAENFPGVLLEDKGCSLALHYRAVRELAPKVLAAAADCIRHFPHMELLPGKDVIELKPAGIDKGSACVEFLRRPPFAGRTPVYVGDDVTDERALVRVHALGGIGISVGGLRRGARYNLKTPAEVRGWLLMLCKEAVGGI
ncbi:MAG: trehalose-phosphatase [Alphaproteobacteria bacterium]|nr:trehalose-phosphatase [Alphaproteobacteria bacterium]